MTQRLKRDYKNFYYENVKDFFHLTVVVVLHHTKLAEFSVS